MNLESAALLANALLTVVIGGIILNNLRLKKLKNHNFYFFWAVGFILYGIQIGIRDLIGTTFTGTILVITAFSLFLGGIWSFNRRKPIMLLTFSIYVISLIMSYLYFIGDIQFASSFIIGTFMSFFPVTLAILYHRSIFGKTVDKLALGWICLCITNILLWDYQWTLNLLAIIFKLVILLGIMDYDFLIIGQKVLRNHSQLLPTYTNFEGEGGFRLVSFNGSESQNDVIEWVNRKTNYNIANNVNTYIFSFQDVVPYKELWRIKWTNSEKVSILLFSSSAEKIKDEFEIFPIDLAHIGAAITEIVKDCGKTNRKGSLIFLDLSVIIHLFGSHSIYQMLLNKMGSLRENKVELFGIFYPKTHDNPCINSLFKNISDETKKE